MQMWLDKGSAGGGCAGAARGAGFTGTHDSLKVTGYRLSHDYRVQEAIQEEARKRLTGLLPLSLEAMGDMLKDRQHKDRAAIAKTILDRTGLHEVTESKHTVEFIGNDPAMLERARQLAIRMKLPVEQLLGKSLARGLPAPTPELVEAPLEAEYEEIEMEPEAEPDSAEPSPAGDEEDSEPKDLQEAGEE